MITNGDMSGSITSEETDVKNLDVASIRVTWDIAGTPDGTLAIEALQEKDNTPISPSDWFTVNLDATIVIDTSETEHQILFEQLPFDKIRLVYTPSSGSGTMNAKITAKQVGG